ncbi:MAG: tRNA (adenosine(37)-N6)-dimethylallyltransferase MiaA [Clostridia bacterium]|nr:tRNA (adenosine(37)-N6)-dimethylallyltransferase MiaA [Clostridia bacterium]
MVQKNSLKKILIICGPTASSKTAVAVECAKLLNTEIISSDSMNVYAGLDIGTAKPTIDERQNIKHHLIDVVAPDKEFSVFDYREMALPIIDNLLSKGKVPIICGGTGFYINSILYDLSYGNSKANPEAREYYKNLSLEKGNQFVYDILMEKDPESAIKLHPNDSKRVIRALEILEQNIKKSDIKDDLIPKYDYNVYSVDFDREILYERINKRVDIMFNLGLVEEIKGLIDKGVKKEFQCMQGIGYKEIFPFLEGELTLEQAKELIKLNTRHYAKRQITFFKKLQNLKLIKPDTPENLAKRIVQEL